MSAARIAVLSFFFDAFCNDGRLETRRALGDDSAVCIDYMIPMMEDGGWTGGEPLLAQVDTQVI